MYTYFSFEPYIARLRNIGAEEEFFSADRTCQAPSLPTLSELQTFGRKKKFNKNLFLQEDHKVFIYRKTKSGVAKETWLLPQSSEIENVQLIAASTKIKNIQSLINMNPLPDGSFSSPEDWKKLKGYATIYNFYRNPLLFLQKNWLLRLQKKQSTLI